jgi:hypothetical protein
MFSTSNEKSKLLKTPSAHSVKEWSLVVDEAFYYKMLPKGWGSLLPFILVYLGIKLTRSKTADLLGDSSIPRNGCEKKIY